MNGSLLFSITFGLFIILVGGRLGWQLLRQNGRILLRLDELEKRLDQLVFGGGGEEPVGLPRGSEASAFELPDLAGERKSLAQFRGQSLLLIFFNPGCDFCRDLVPRLAEISPSPPQHASTALQSQWDCGLQPKVAKMARPARTELPWVGAQTKPNSEGVPPLTQPRILIISTGDHQVNRAFFSEHKLGCPVLLQKELEVAAAYQANGTPSGYLIAPDGKIASQLAMGAEALLELFNKKSKVENYESNESLSAAITGVDDRGSRFSRRSLARSKIKRDGLKAGTAAPDFRLPRLDGRGDLMLSELRGRRVMLVFSSPCCGPCNMLAPELEQFHRGHPNLEVVMVSKGEPKENRAKVKEHGLTFPVVLQQQWEISRRYAMFATPVAYLIDEAGVILHDVAVGVEPIRSLMASESKFRKSALSDSLEVALVDNGI